MWTADTRFHRTEQGMAVEAAILIFLTLSMTSAWARDGDLLHSACEEACQQWESIREECFKAKCQSYVDEGKDWFPCFLSCWDLSRPCLSRCADSFWNEYSSCSLQCVGRTGRQRWRCRRACAIQRFVESEKKLVFPSIPRIKVDVAKRISPKRK